MKNLSYTLAALLLLLFLSPENVIARKKKKVQEPEKPRTEFPSGVVDEYVFRGGRAVVKGRLTGFDTGKMPKTLTCNVGNIFTHEESKQLIKVDGQGEFVCEVDLPHAQVVYIIPLSAFLFPGDTLECEYDARTEQTVYRGENRSAQVSTLYPEWKKHYFGDSPAFCKRIVEEELMPYRDKQVEVMDRIMRDVNEGTLPCQVTDTLTCDILVSSVLAEAFTRVMDAHMDVTRIAEKQVNDSLYYDFLAEREHVLMDNPLFVFDPDQWVMANRMDFELFNKYHRQCERRQSTWFYGSDSPEMKNYRSNFLLPEQYDGAFYREALDYRKGKLYTRSALYTDVRDLVNRKLHVGNNFLFQLNVCRSSFNDLRLFQESKELTPSVAMELLAAVLPQLTHPVVCHHFLNGYRRFVVKTEAKSREVSATPEADSILRRITAPYAGNVLVLDFWDYSCGPCRAGMMSQRELVKQMEGRPVKFLYICNEQTTPRELADKFFVPNQIGGEHIFISHDEWNYLSAKLNFSGIPFMCTVDKEGNISPQNSRGIDKEQLETLMAP